MTFFGACVKVGEKTELSGLSDADLLHLSSIVLSAVPSKGERFLLHLADAEGKEYLAAALDADNSSRSIDLYVPAGIQVRLSGPSSSKIEAHLTGYSEPMMISDDEEEGSEASSDEEGDLNVESLSNRLAETLKGFRESSSKETTAEASEESDTDEEEANEAEEEDSDMGDAEEPGVSQEEEGSEEESSEEGSEDGSEDSSDSEESEVEAPVEPAPKKSQKKSMEHSTPKKEEVKEPKKEESKKRKSQTQPEGAPAAKKAASGPEGSYESAILSFMKTQGNSCKISAIGAKVKKPSEMKATKLGAFLRERSNIFVVSGENVSLKK